MFKLELIPTNMPRIIKLQYKAVLKSFFGNLKRRENKRNIKEATNGAIMIPNMLKKKINTTDDVLFNKFILFIKKFSFTKCGSNRYFYQVFWQFLKNAASPLAGEPHQSGRRIFAAEGGEGKPPD